tara:strand:+ start:284 stop:898 length:615 start_codon:yes stop_codon:yes gene_type:complete
MKQYLFGYGSLINKESRLRTAKTGEAVPVRVAGLQRAWNYHNPRRKRNVLGATFVEGSTCNGVIVEVSQENLEKLDERENGYDRMELKAENISILGEGEINLTEGKFWVYIPKEPKAPCENSPIQQSYIDVVIFGSLEISEEFAVELIKTTLYWECPWIDDRENPGYIRTLVGLPVKEVDRILNKVIPQHLKNRKKLEEKEVKI